MMPCLPSEGNQRAKSIMITNMLVHTLLPVTLVTFLFSAMASMDLSDELDCSICLNIYTDPVTLKCGHNFCRFCIDQVLNIQEGSRLYSCPECREEFKKRPALKRNIALNNVAERFLSTQPHQEEITGICCTYCVDSPVPAVRSCLLCEASLCEKHLRVHSKGPEHVLTEPSTSLETRKCSVHKKILEYYCTEDAACICASCSLVGKHRGHRVEMLDEASEKKKKKLRNVLQKLVKNRGKTERRVQSLEEHRRKAQEKSSGKAKSVTALFIDIRRWVDDLEKKVLSEISRWEDQVSLSLSALIHQLEIKKDELSRKMRHIEELCNMTDPLTVLQEPDTGDLCDPEEEEGDEDTGGQDGGDEDTGGHDGGDEDTGGQDGGDEDTGGHDGGDEDTGGHDGGDEDTGGHDGGDEDTGGHKTHGVDVDVIAGILHAGFSDILTYLQTVSPAKPKETRPQPPKVKSLLHHMQDLSFSGIKHGGDDGIVRTVGAGGKVKATGKVEIYGEGPADILLDVNTAGNNLLISGDLKTATWTEITQNCPETAERFQYNQVMSRRRFTSGRHCWDVKISRSWEWRVGMCYPSVDRRCQSNIGDNNKSWCLYGGRGYNNKYSVRHSNKVIKIPDQTSSDRVRICLDYGTGLLYNNPYSSRHDSNEIPLCHQFSSNRFRICLDYEAGQLSFYELCDPIRHLHTFTAAFSEPLHAAIYVCDGSIHIFSGGISEEPKP
ncbi:E3 ubiquitin/ISG15 ligase TRIM25-like [Dendrobates tinctorius]|uniref:E3 ubiquitin/ISG15 ligase TRIM25-like n=1 Tax=Dendrobates tinctorius TaxID=92724 RepID=UPI003CC9DD10